MGVAPGAEIFAVGAVEVAPGGDVVGDDERAHELLSVEKADQVEGIVEVGTRHFLMILDGGGFGKRWVGE